MRRDLTKSWSLVGFFILLATSLQAQDLDKEQHTNIETDIAIYGATPAGIAAAISAARDGHQVLLITPYRNIGGLTTNGLSNTDFHSFEGLTGTFLKFTQQVQKYYDEKYGPDSVQSVAAFRGTRGEPHVNLHVYEQMLREGNSVVIKRRLRLASVKTNAAGTRIESASFLDSNGQSHVVAARIFIDATYEGDLMAAANVPFRVGRESRAEFGESLAPEMADDQVQGYNFRFVMTQDAANRMPVQAPAGYDAETFSAIIPFLKNGEIETVFCARKGGIYKAHLPALPNAKHDINDVSRNVVRLSLPQFNNAWPDGTQEIRQEIFNKHLQHNVGLLYFLQTDPRVPDLFREEALTWGWCRDEFAETDHIPEQLYVREARRMVGKRIYTQLDCQYAGSDARAVFHEDSIAIGEYSLNCHGTGHEGPIIGGKHTGEFYQSTPPYQIPYGTICPQLVTNLLVPVACSASHVGFCCLRLEPIWSDLGDAAGVAASLAIQESAAVQSIDVRKIQQLLHANATATIYVSDVLPGDPDFAAVQWWGMRGGLHGLEPRPSGSPRGKGITGQYFEAYLRHEAKLDNRLDNEVRVRWLAICREHGVPLPDLRSVKTRRDFVRLVAAE